MSMQKPQQEGVRACVFCGTTKTSEYKGMKRWHRARIGNGWECHKCYSKKHLAAETATVIQEKEVKSTPSIATMPMSEKMLATKKLVNDAKTEAEMQAACKSYTNYWERKKREGKLPAGS